MDPADLKNIIAVAASGYGSYALDADGSLWTWGRNAYGQLGLGDTTERDFPVHLLPPTGSYYSAIDGDGNGSSGLGHVTAILTQGSPVVVPEPSTYALALLGGAGMLTAARRRLRRA